MGEDAPRKRPDETAHELSLNVAEETTLEQQNEDSWACHVCSFRNHELLPSCEMCNSPKEAEPMGMQSHKNPLKKKKSTIRAEPVKDYSGQFNKLKKDGDG